MQRSRFASFLACIILCVGASAYGDPSADADAHFRVGKQLLSSGRTAEACAAFDTAQHLAPTTNTLLNQANCREKNGQLATSLALFVEAARQTRTSTDEATLQLRAIWLEHAKKLRDRVSRLTVHVPDERKVVGLEIVRDGETIKETDWNQPEPIDGGTHTIVAHAPGVADWSTTITVATEGEAKVVEIPKGFDAIHEVEPGGAVSSVAEPGSSNRFRTAPLVVGGAALLALGGALAFDLWGNSTYAASKIERDYQKQDALWHSANNKRYVAETLVGAGVAAAGVAIWLYLRTESGNDSSTRSGSHGLTLAPAVSGHQATLVIDGTY